MELENLKRGGARSNIVMTSRLDRSRVSGTCPARLIYDHVSTAAQIRGSGPSEKYLSKPTPIIYVREYEPAAERAKTHTAL